MPLETKCILWFQFFINNLIVTEKYKSNSEIKIMIRSSKYIYGLYWFYWSEIHVFLEHYHLTCERNLNFSLHFFLTGFKKEMFPKYKMPILLCVAVKMISNIFFLTLLNGTIFFMIIALQFTQFFVACIISEI